MSLLCPYYMQVLCCTLFLFRGTQQQQIQHHIPKDARCAAEEGELNMLGGDGFCDTKTNQNQAAQYKTYKLKKLEKIMIIKKKYIHILKLNLWHGLVAQYYLH